MMFRKKKAEPIPLREKTAFSLHLTYSVIEGFILGIFALNEFVFIKSMNRSSFELGLLFQFSLLVFLFLLFINEFVRRVANKRKMVFLAGLVARIPLLLFVFFPGDAAGYENGYYHVAFLAIFLVYYLGNPLIFPQINYFLKNSYRHENFGYLYSYSTSVNKIVMLVITFLYGIYLDTDPFAFRYVLPLTAVAGIISSWFLSRIPFKEKRNNEVAVKGFLEGIRISAANMWRILKENRPFLLFQIAFMFYGYSFMASTPVVTLFYKDVLDLNYMSVAFYRNAYNIAAIILLPFAGRFLDRVGAGRFGIVTFLSLALYFVFVALTQYFPAHSEGWGITFYWSMVIATLFHGAFAATMALLWNIGSAYFCKNEEAGEYHNVHLFLTGFRALYSPMIGIVVFELLGYTANFAVSVISLLIGILVLYWSFSRKKNAGALVLMG